MAGKMPLGNPNSVQPVFLGCLRYLESLFKGLLLSPALAIVAFHDQAHVHHLLLPPSASARSRIFNRKRLLKNF
jgi:hypothetical protein